MSSTRSMSCGRLTAPMSPIPTRIFSINICAVLHCTPDSIHGIIPIKTGLTNLSFKFTCNGRDYVYRHPGAGTEAYIDRPAEARALEVAKALGLDDTFLYIDAAKGWKISHYIEDAAILDYHNTEQVDTALRMLRRLHTSGIQLDGRFDIWEKINGFLDLLQGRTSPTLPACRSCTRRCARCTSA